MTPRNVDRYTRAGRHGRQITCPDCGEIARVYHFAWCAITCSGCDRMIDKENWLITPD
jgi:ribosomal protein S27E